MSKPLCSEEGCESKAVMRGLCVKHYNVRKAAGTLPAKKSGGFAAGARPSRSRAPAGPANLGDVGKRIGLLVAERDRYKAEADGLRKQFEELRDLVADQGA